GGPQYDQVERSKRPEAALLRLRHELDMFANIRPARVFTQLLAASTLKPEIIDGLDIVIVRELTAGVYFGTPRGEQTLPDGTKRVVDTQSYTHDQISRIATVAFDLARQRGKAGGKKTVHSLDKANVLETGAFWRRVVNEVYGQHGDITLHHMYADNAAMQLMKNPKQFDVMGTDNLFGDILSDAAAMATGSLGMLPSASLGAVRADGTRAAMYEPIHGSAPDIAGKNLANPLAAILSLAMACRYSFDNEPLARKIESAVERVLARGLRTADIKDASTKQPATTSQMGDAVVAEL
ncbi:MAG: 3-isopropylmalate dehydrogenase, partial [Alphaproteobacteria bacterium]|nr:3-isopropylmalate dehydrogenase [Alphaproteobacteria bacterium]